jgi:ABC-type nitrate/sulfonate/bicarbonate transport system substrate-binding protein
VVLDVRRGDGPSGCFNYTAAVLAATDALIARAPETAAAAIRAIVKTQSLLKRQPQRATEVGKKLFPRMEAELIAELIRRDAPYYSAAITPDFVAAMQRFARNVGILGCEVPYESVVATQFAELWTTA